jgi:hypothetical protein
MPGLRLPLFFGLFFAAGAAAGQSIQIELGPSSIGENQAYTISITARNESIKSYNNFPDIPGMRKRGTSSSQQTNIINGQVTSSQSIIMTYTPTGQGVFEIAPFTMTVNGQKITSPGGKVTVGPAAQQRAPDPFRSFFDFDPFSGPRGEVEYLDIKEDAFLALTTDKDEVYVGEGFTTSLAFYVSESNQAPMQFHELGKQLAEILKKIRPSTCWEENFNIENIEGERVTIRGKDYTQYRIYQATYFPLNNQSVKFPSVGLEMIKYKVARNPSFFGQNRQEDFKTFYSAERTVKVKDLPPHPLREGVAVGDFRLNETVDPESLQTGESATYEFSVYGTGNIASVGKPQQFPNPDVEIYEPNVRQTVRRENGRVSGIKTFSYFVIPREPGALDLSNYFQWVYFNTSKNSYDTLRPSARLAVGGVSKKNEVIEATDLGSFYDRIYQADNTLRAVGEPGWIKIGINLFIFVLLGASVYLVFFRKS